MDWLELHRGEAPLIVAFPHTGAELPAPFDADLVSPWLARKDADWRIETLYAFARDLGATTIRTSVSRSIIDVNRDPSGASLYPGMTTTELCPTTTFDGEALYREGAEPSAESIEARRERFFAPYHHAIAEQAQRLRARHGRVVLYDAHAIRSRVPRLFDGELPHFNIGTNSGASCAETLARAVTSACAASKGFTHVRDGRFKGGYTTRHHGRPADGVHAIQMELAFRAFVREPDAPSEANWPPTFNADYAAPAQTVLSRVLNACLNFATDRTP